MADSRVVCLLGQGFEDSEFRIPTDRLVAAGVVVDIVGDKAGESLSGYRGKETVKTDLGIDQVRLRDYSALLIPGGQSPDHLRADRRFVEFVKDFDATGRPIAAVCHGPQLLIAAGLVKGRTLTAWKTIQDDSRQIGAHVRDQPVVIDGNWITSRQPEDLEAFSQALLRALGFTPSTEITGEPDHDESSDEDASDQPSRGVRRDRTIAERPGLSADAATHRDTQRQLEEAQAEASGPPTRQNR